MATGASTCDLAVILIDARHGVQVQTRRHSFIASLLGIKHIVVAVNKMDLMDFSQQVFEDIVNDYRVFAEKLAPAEFHFIPISALDGDNVVSRSERSPWYKGEPLMSLLETVEIRADRNFSDFRLPVQIVNRPNLNFRGFCGTVASGVIHKGDEVTVLPSGKSSRVKSIVTYDEELELAFTDMAITLTLEDEIDVSRGDVIAHSDNLPTLSDAVSATVVWMTETPLLPGNEYELKIGSKSVSGRVDVLHYRSDVNTLEQSPAPALELNEIGLVEWTLSDRVCFDDYGLNRATGSFIVIDKLSNVTVGAGMIKAVREEHGQLSRRGGHVTTEERAARYGQIPMTVMFIGVSGSGKSTLAHGLERKLFDKGRVATVLDGKTMRLGISKDLPHDAEGRAENLRRSAHIARFLNDSGLICCASFVAPNEDSRSRALGVIGRESCLVVYLNPPFEVCRGRDPSGLYASAEGGDSADVPGLSFPYPPPSEVDLELDTHALNVDACLDQVWRLLKQRNVIT
jgi:bifunctional enzyme CysN/CysC